MAENILSSLLSVAAFSITNATTGAVVAPNLAVKKVGIRYSSKNMTHQLEDGSTIVDQRIIVPSGMVVEAYCPDIDTVDAINALLLDRSAMYTINSKGIIIQNTMADSDNFRQNAEMLSATPIRIRFKQQLIQGVAPVVCSQSADSSVLDRGIQLLSSSSQSVSGFFSTLTGNISGTFGG